MNIQREYSKLLTSIERDIRFSKIEGRIFVKNRCIYKNKRELKEYIIILNYVVPTNFINRSNSVSLILEEDSNEVIINENIINKKYYCSIENTEDIKKTILKIINQFTKNVEDEYEEKLININ